MIALLLLVQAPTVPAGGPPQSHSVLHQPCASSDTDVVVCARKPERLPPGERGSPDGPRRPTGDPMAGLEHAGEGACASRQKGCTVGVDMIGAGVAAVRLVGKLIDPNSCCDEPGQATNPVALIKDAAGALRKKPDRSNRVAINLDAPPPSTAGRLSP